jgi:hypothetical protein
MLQSFVAGAAPTGMRPLEDTMIHDHVYRKQLATNASQMKLTDVQDYAIQAMMAIVVGAEEYDRLFAGIRFDEVDGDLMYAIARNGEVAEEIEEQLGHYISLAATAVLKQEIDLVVALPKVLN